MKCCGPRGPRGSSRAGYWAARSPSPARVDRDAGQRRHGQCSPRRTSSKPTTAKSRPASSPRSASAVQHAEGDHVVEAKAAVGGSATRQRLAPARPCRPRGSASPRRSAAGSAAGPPPRSARRDSRPRRSSWTTMPRTPPREGDPPMPEADQMRGGPPGTAMIVRRRHCGCSRHREAAHHGDDRQSARPRSRRSLASVPTRRADDEPGAPCSRIDCITSAWRSGFSPVLARNGTMPGRLERRARCRPPARRRRGWSDR